MEHASPALIALLVLFWGTLAALVAVFLRMALRSDAGWGAGGRGRRTI